MKKLSLWAALLPAGFMLVDPGSAFGAAAQSVEPAPVSCFPLWSLAPFLLMLVSIAVLPMTVPRWWDSNRNKTLLSVAMSLPVLTVVMPCNPQLLWHSLLDYVSFLTLLGSLFIISGGIYIKGEFAGTPLVNAIFLGIGALFANLIGTTGASMLLIRPFLRANHLRRHRAHLIVFFIFIVSNTAGLLTPLGDPPLFLGFLRGVPFQFTLRLLPHWALVVGSLLMLFNIYDQFVFTREEIETHRALAEIVQARHPLQILGARNFFYLLGVMAAAVLSGHFGWPRGVQEAIMVTMARLSWYTTPRSIHRENHFHFSPIIEVAALFLGIFVTMVPALEILNFRASGWNMKAPWHFFWMSGVLSSVLDNAPTYLTFTAMASGLIGTSVQDLGLMLRSEVGQTLLAAVSCGSVFMGANTYIGNGPNFMVKSIAEGQGIKMPSFGGYMVYSGLILIPLFVIVTLVFFRG
ncbi:MAG TPA: sodium:proton antiporter [Terriglobia bacterium]|nr:sodium:proton antiporter [Terriglobia bacterium]